MNTSNDILDEIIAGLEPENIPIEFIIMAKITDLDGEERILQGEELTAFMKNPMDFAMSAKIILDVKKLRRVIVKLVNEIYDEVNIQFSK